MDKDDVRAQPAGSGHPLPDSDEARKGEIPEHIVRDKGGDPADGAQDEPQGERIAPDGTPYKA
jgi:hypothetical protein